MSTFFVRADEPKSRIPKGSTVLEEGKTLYTGLTDFEKVFDVSTTMEADLLRVASAIFASDRACPRGERENVGRQIALSIPVSNIANWLPLNRNIERVLRFLSNDGWTIEFRPHRGGAEADHAWPKSDGYTLLFSGGLDSLAAAVEFGTKESRLQLVSHRTQNTVTSTTQRKLAATLLKKRAITAHHQFFISSRTDDQLTHDAENSQRTRSFVFLVIGAIAARRTGQRKLVYLAENGQMAIHLPLDSSRIGAFSTHTAHPEVLAAMTSLLSTALNVQISIENPYVYKTKGEVIAPLVKLQKDLIPASTSCWRNSRLTARVTHCGSCVPCQVRRIAIETRCEDLTAYGVDIWRQQIRELPWDDDGRRNLYELVQFVVQFDSLNAEELISTWPELLSAHFDAAQVIQMYKRFAREALQVWRKYPEVEAIMQ